MIALTVYVDEFDYSDKLDKQLPVIFEAMSSGGEINPVMKLACNSPAATARIVKGILKAMSREQKERLAVRMVNSNRTKLMSKVNQLAANYGIVVNVCDCKAEKL